MLRAGGQQLAGAVVGHAVQDQDLHGPGQSLLALKVVQEALDVFALVAAGHEHGNQRIHHTTSGDWGPRKGRAGTPPTT